jgi:hypothetical protein
MARVLNAAVVLSGVMTLGVGAQAQLEGPVPTQVLVNVDAKSTAPSDASAITVTVDNKKEPLTAWAQVLPANAQVALLIDDGLRETVSRELSNLRNFVGNLPQGVEVMVGYMQYGHVDEASPFTTDHTAAATSLHLPGGIAGMSASPYICLSDFVKKWPGSGHKARFVIMITDGVDPYNGSTSVMNQDSPYVTAAIEDSQRAGVSVSAIYFSDAGIRGGSADNSGQNYLAQVAQATGGVSYWEGVGNPVSTAPYLKQFQDAIGETFVATFNAPAGKDPGRDLVHVKFASSTKAKLHAPQAVLPGNVE